jgi:hypothetical protein
MIRLGDQRGQTTAEYMGLLVLVGAIIAAIAASGVGGAITAGIERAICMSVGDGPCPTVAAQLAQDDDDEREAGQDAEESERRELERARAEFKDTQARAMMGAAGSMRPLSEVEGQSPGDWVLGGLGELSGVNDADRGITQLGEGDIAGGAFSLAMAWPGAKAFKLGKEGIEEGVEQIGGRQFGRSGARAADNVLPTPSVSPSQPKLQNIVDDLYRGTTNPQRVGNGTTMDAIRHELATGQAVHGRRHLEKGQIYSNGLRNWLRRNPGASDHDRRVAQSLYDELQAAMRGQ